MAPLAAYLQLFPLVRVLLGPLLDDVSDPIPRLGISPVVHQDAINHHSNLFFRMPAIICHNSYLLIRSGRSHGVKI